MGYETHIDITDCEVTGDKLPGFLGVIVKHAQVDGWGEAELGELLNLDFSDHASILTERGTIRKDISDLVRDLVAEDTCYDLTLELSSNELGEIVSMALPDNWEGNLGDLDLRIREMMPFFNEGAHVGFSTEDNINWSFLTRCGQVIITGPDRVEVVEPTGSARATIEGRRALASQIPMYIPEADPELSCRIVRFKLTKPILDELQKQLDDPESDLNDVDKKFMQCVIDRNLVKLVL